MRRPTGRSISPILSILLLGLLAVAPSTPALAQAEESFVGRVPTVPDFLALFPFAGEGSQSGREPVTYGNAPSNPTPAELQMRDAAHRLRMDFRTRLIGAPSLQTTGELDIPLVTVDFNYAPARLAVVEAALHADDLALSGFGVAAREVMGADRARLDAVALYTSIYGAKGGFRADARFQENCQFIVSTMLAVGRRINDYEMVVDRTMTETSTEIIRPTRMALTTLQQRAEAVGREVVDCGAIEAAVVEADGPGLK